MTETRKHFAAEQRLPSYVVVMLDQVAIANHEEFNAQLSEVWREALRLLAPGGPSDQLGTTTACRTRSC